MTNRLHTVTVRIPRNKTKLRGAMFCHVDIEPDGRFHSVRFSHKWKEFDNTLDETFTAMGDAATEAYAEFLKDVAYKNEPKK